jgi:hypothetical protein
VVVAEAAGPVFVVAIHVAADTRSIEDVEKEDAQSR